MGGFFGVASTTDCVADLFYGTDYHSHLGTRRGGLVTAVFGHGRVVKLVAGDTKGVQLSIFADGIEGSFWIEITGDLTEPERAFLEKRPGHLDPRR
jgi:hypothetical protein